MFKLWHLTDNVVNCIEKKVEVEIIHAFIIAVYRQLCILSAKMNQMGHFGYYF